jgi:hypothetical protein
MTRTILGLGKYDPASVNAYITVTKNGKTIRKHSPIFNIWRSVLTYAKKRNLAPSFSITDFNCFVHWLKVQNSVIFDPAKHAVRIIKHYNGCGKQLAITDLVLVEKAHHNVVMAPGRTRKTLPPWVSATNRTGKKYRATVRVFKPQGPAVTRYLLSNDYENLHMWALDQKIESLQNLICY